MKPIHENIDQMLPYGELLRGFAAQTTISKGELKSLLKNRGIFLNNNDKESSVPCISTLLLSPTEFEKLKEHQNTREDNLKKSSSRIELQTDIVLLDSLPEIDELLASVTSEYINYKLTSPPRYVVNSAYPDKVEVHFEIERYDLNKSWFESKNIFTGSLQIEKLSDSEISVTKSYTSFESEEVANKFQNFFVQHLKTVGAVKQETEIKRILFKDFTNKDRIHFFWSLTSRMEGIYFEFVDIEDMEFRPDETNALPEKIDWMAKKKELILKGTDIHNTFFIREESYYPYLQFWALVARFKFNYNGSLGSCVVNFLFRDFDFKEGESEFEINISSFVPENSSLGLRERYELKQILLNLLERKKNEIYRSFIPRSTVTAVVTSSDGTVVTEA